MLTSGGPISGGLVRGFPVEQSLVVALALLGAGLGLLALSRRPLRPRRTTISALLAGDDPRYP